MCLKRMSCDTRVADAETFEMWTSQSFDMFCSWNLFSLDLSCCCFFLRFPSHLFSSHPMSSHLIWCFLISSLFYSDRLNFSQFMSSHFCVSLMGFLQTETWWDSWLSKIKHGKWESRILFDEIMIQQKTEWEWVNSENHARMDILLPVVSWTPGQGLASPQAIRRFRFKSGADTFDLCSYYSRKFIEKIFPKISKFYHSSGLLILEIWSHVFCCWIPNMFHHLKTTGILNPPAKQKLAEAAPPPRSTVVPRFFIGEWCFLLLGSDLKILPAPFIARKARPRNGTI